jgi:hypothetical protein
MKRYERRIDDLSTKGSTVQKISRGKRKNMCACQIN